MSEVPGDKIVDLIEGSDRHMHGVRHKFAVKYPSRNVSFRQNSDLIHKIQVVHSSQQLQVTGTMRFVYAFDLASNKDRTARPILSELALEPSDSKIASERITVIQIRADHRSFEVEAEFHL